MKYILILLGSIINLLAVETLVFDASLTTNVNYKIKWGTNAGETIGSIVLGTNTIISLTNGPWGRYYFTAYAISTNNIESLPSNEIITTNRPSSPLTLRITNSITFINVLASYNGGASWIIINKITNNPIERSAIFKAAITNKPPLPF